MQVGRARRRNKYCGEFASAAHQEGLPGAQDTVDDDGDGDDDGDDGNDGGDDDDGGDGYSDDTPRCGSNHGDTCDFPAYRDKTGSSKLCSPFAQVYILLSICKYRLYPSSKIYDHQKHQHHLRGNSHETFSA